MESLDKRWSDVNEMTSSFMEVYEKCLVASIPKKEVKLNNRRSKPHWWNEELSEAKCKWNVAEKSFKRRQTPINLQMLKEKETEIYKQTKQKAKERMD